jgi:pimeloyl-ACP methyl ester carboxylesterase
MASFQSYPVEVAAQGLMLSGLVALPKSPARALVVALHGHGMSARYFDGPADPQLSLLELGARLGFAVWAPDRPGYGASVSADSAALAMFPQAVLLASAIDVFRVAHAIRAPCFVVGHSFGLKLALAMASLPLPFPLLGIDGSGSGLRYAFEPGLTAPVAQPGDVNATWGPRHLYPDATFDRKRSPATRMAEVPAGETEQWPEVFRSFADRVGVPVRITFGDCDRLWVVEQAHFDELRSTLVASSRVEVGVQIGAGHNVSLARTARAYHLKALAFAEECLAAAHAGS